MQIRSKVGNSTFLRRCAYACFFVAFFFGAIDLWLYYGWLSYAPVNPIVNQGQIVPFKIRADIHYITTEQKIIWSVLLGLWLAFFSIPLAYFLITKKIPNWDGTSKKM